MYICSVDLSIYYSIYFKPLKYITPQSHIANERLLCIIVTSLINVNTVKEINLSLQNLMIISIT